MIDVGTGPDSWGVWFADAPGQIGWKAYLDEVAKAGYRFTEIGPYGYAPPDPKQVVADLAAVGLGALASFAEVDLSAPDSHDSVVVDVDRVAALVAEVGGRFVNVIDATYRDLSTGVDLGPAELDAERWQRLTATCNELGRLVGDRYGLMMTFHPHVDTHVERTEQIERLLADTDPAVVSLVFDTGHHAYRGGDALEFFEAHHERIAYLHLKSIDPDIRTQIDDEDLPLVEGVKRGVFCEPSHGGIDFAKLAKLIADVDFTGAACVEQDMHQPADGVALDIAARTRVYLQEIGLG